MENLVVKYVDEDIKRGSDSILVLDVFTLVFNDYLLELKNVFNIELDELIEIISNYRNSMVIQIEIDDIPTHIEVIKRHDKSILLRLANKVKDEKTKFIMKQEYEKAAWMRDIEKKIEISLNT